MGNWGRCMNLVSNRRERLVGEGKFGQCAG